MRQAGEVAQQLAFDAQSAAEHLQSYLTDKDDDKCPDLVVRCVKDGDVTKVIGDVSFGPVAAGGKEWRPRLARSRPADPVASRDPPYRSESKVSARKDSNVCSAIVRRTRASAGTPPFPSPSQLRP
jgi:hypothetical protein